jgi:hypothetical protein
MARDSVRAPRSIGEIGESKPNLKQRVFSEAARFVVMFLYLLVVFGVFNLQRSAALAQLDADSQFDYGFAAINAFVFAKVMLVAEDLKLGRRFQNWPLIVPIVYKSLAYSLVFLSVHVLERIAIGTFHGKTVLESLPPVGGDLKITVIATLICTINLVPYFAYQEFARIIGYEKIKSLLFAPQNRPERKRSFD